MYGAIKTRRVVRILAGIAGGLVLAGLAAGFVRHGLGHDTVFGLVQRFDLDGEANVPAWFSSSALLLCAVVLGLIASRKRAEQDPWTRHWFALSAVLALLSLDEAARLHEMLIKPLRGLLGATGLFHFAWIIPGSIVLGVFLLLMGRFIRHLPRRTREMFQLAAALYFGGALGMEAVNGLYSGLYGESNMGYALLVAAEEGLEMSGIVAFLHSLMRYMSVHANNVWVRIDRSSRVVSIHAARRRSVG